MLLALFARFAKPIIKMLHAPAADRNKDAILDVLKGVLSSGKEPLKVLEVASGTGQHVAHFACHLPHVMWHPSDIDDRHLKSISAHKEDKNLKNVSDPIHLDMLKPSSLSDHPNLSLESFDMVLNSNMVHISPWGTAVGLFHTAGKLLKQDGILCMYGPFRINGVLTPDSNVRFDKGLKSQDPSWGVRDTDDLKKLATENGLTYENMVDMPANNKCLFFRKKSTT